MVLMRERGFQMIPVILFFVTITLALADTPQAAPVHFELNRGQTPGAAEIVGIGQGVSFTLTSSQAEISSGLKLKWVGGSPGKLVAEQLLVGVSNYYPSPDRSKWLTGVPNFGRARVAHVYPGIDLVFHSSDQHGGSGLEYDFEVAPGSDPSKIRLKLEGGTIRLSKAGDLEIILASGDLVTQTKPVAYQIADDGRRQIVPAKYRLRKDNEFEIALGHYEKNRRLVIDPTIATWNRSGGASAIAVDNAGNVLFGGPSSITKLMPDGTQISRTTFGSGGEEVLAIATDASGNIYLTGSTSSSALPIIGGYQTSLAGSTDAYVVKLSPTGALLYSTYLGGTGAETGSAIAVDSAGAIIVGGYTCSVNFPTVAGYQLTSAGFCDGFVTKTNVALNAPVFSTYLGGSADDRVTALTLDSSNAIYVVGTTGSPNFPTVNAAQPSFGGVQDGFLAKLDASGASLAFSTFLGGSSFDSAVAIARDSSGAIYVGGSTASADFPTLGTLQPYSQGSNPASSNNYDAFVAKFSSNGTKLYATYLGGSLSESLIGIFVDSSGRVLAVGTTDSFDFPTLAAFDPFPTGNGGFFTVINAAGTALESSSYLHATLGTFLPFAGFSRVAVDSSGNAYVVGGYTIMGETSTFVPYSVKIAPGGPPPVAVGIATVPAGIIITVDGSPVLAPKTLQWVPQIVDSIVYALHSLSAPTTAFVGGNTYNFVSWSNGGAQSQRNIATPSAATSYMATYALQANCNLTLASSSVLVGNAGYNGTIGYTAPTGCTFSPSSNASWLTGFVDGSSLSYSVAANTSGATRTGVITVAGATFTVTQQACTFTFPSNSRTVSNAALTDTLSVTTFNGCIWTPTSNVPWLSVSGNPITSSGSFSYSVAANNASTPRTGVIAVGGSSTFTITQQQQGSQPVLSALPVAQPTQSNGASTFVMTFTDDAGAANLNILNALINAQLDGRSACYLAFDYPNKLLYLVKDDGGSLSGAMQFNSSTGLATGFLSNSQCMVNGSGTSFTTSANSITLTISLTPNPATFGGNRAIYLATRDKANGNSGWLASGYWQVPVVSPTYPAVVSGTIATSAASPNQATVTMKYRDAAYNRYLAVSQLLIMDGIDGRNACYLGYDHLNNALFLVDDAGGDLLVPAITPGSVSGSVANSQCQIQANGTTLTENGPEYSLSVNVTFKPGFAGRKFVYGGVQTGSNSNSGWVVVNQITIPCTSCQ